jgi:hypothetical protein
MMTPRRKRDVIKVLDTTAQQQALAQGLQCQNCKERHYFVSREGDLNNAFCTHCGHLTPLRQMKHGRGLTAPAAQQQTAIVQQFSQDGQPKKRRPKGIADQKQDQLAQELINKGFMIIDSQTITRS